MNRLLETHHFKNSRRYPALLRFIVEETLEGRGEFLKERLLGVRVFDRPADYDTASDPIVRVTIAEIRKRIAQYYHDEEHDAEIRIELLPGRYEPEFRARHSKRETAIVATVVTEVEEILPVVEASAPAPATSTDPVELAKAKPGRNRLWYLLGAALLVFALVSAGILRWLHPPALEALWSPLLSGQGSVLFCLPTDVEKRRGPTGDPVPDKATAPAKKLTGRMEDASTFRAHQALGENVVYSDMLAALRVANVMAVHQRSYTVRLTVSTTLEDLRQGPTVLIGGLDNQWTIRALTNLRYHFAGSDDNRYWIQDQENPANQRWSLDLKEPIASVTRDYAIVSRLHNEQTGQVEMIIAGIGMTGTAAAGEFISDDHRAAELRQRIGAGFNDKDFEVVLSTDVVNGIAGAAKIEAVSVW
ncbi:hypothetical protein [Granulicella sibirica]|nr:hypothetical protein [Granulicella sibirica]